jgi:hypothetical protein
MGGQRKFIILPFAFFLVLAAAIERFLFKPEGKVYDEKAGIFCRNLY